MSLTQQVQRALPQDASLGSAPLLATDGHLRCVAQLTAVDAIGCAFLQLAVETDHLAAATVAQLEAVAGELTRRLTYLLEPLAPVETDAQRALVQCRSQPPERNDDGAHYYELLVERGGRASLCRYHAPPGKPRQRVPAEVTRQVFLRLVEDFGEVLG